MPDQNSTTPYLEIPLTQDFVALIDAEDLPLVSPYKWHVAPRRIRRYAAGALRKDAEHTRIYMHRLIANAPPGVEVDHGNLDGLDNRKSNLRLCDASTNRMNCSKPTRQHSTSRYRGVSWNHNKWEARVYFRRKCVARKRFATEREAALFYNESVVKILGPNMTILNDVT